MQTAGHAWVAMAAVLLLVSAFATGDTTNGRSGTKQGPLLMIDDIRAAADAFLEGHKPAGGVDTAALADRIASGPPAEEDWVLPKAPTVAEGAKTFGPPFERGCCTSAGGSGRAEAPPGLNRGQLAVDILAGSGQWGYVVDSPCLKFTAPVTGVARLRTAVVVNGLAAADTGASGHALARLGVWIAHCHPKTEGRYSEKVAWQLEDVSGVMRFENAVLMHQASMPVKEGVEYLFGTGISATCMARDGASAGMKLFGRLAYLTVEFEGE